MECGWKRHEQTLPKIMDKVLGRADRTTEEQVFLPGMLSARRARGASVAERTRRGYRTHLQKMQSPAQHRPMAGRRLILGRRVRRRPHAHDPHHDNSPEEDRRTVVRVLQTRHIRSPRKPHSVPSLLEGHAFTPTPPGLLRRGRARARTGKKESGRMSTNEYERVRMSTNIAARTGTRRNPHGIRQKRHSGLI